MNRLSKLNTQALTMIGLLLIITVIPASFPNYEPKYSVKVDRRPFGVRIVK